MRKTLTKILFTGTFLLSLLASGCENVKIRFFSGSEHYKNKEHATDKYAPITIPITSIEFSMPKYKL